MLAFDDPGVAAFAMAEVAGVLLVLLALPLGAVLLGLAIHLAPGWFFKHKAPIRNLVQLEHFG